MENEIENVSTPAEGGQAVVETEAPEQKSESYDLDAAIDKALESLSAVEKPAEEEPAGEEEVEDTEVAEEAEAIEEEPAVEEEVTAPEDWPEEHKEAFAKLPKEAREILLEKSKNFQADYTKKTQALAERRRLADEVESKIVTAYGDLLKQHNVPVSTVIERLIAAERFATQNPVAFVQQFVHNNRIDLAKLMPAAAGSEQANARGVDPATVDQLVAARLAPVQKAIEQQQLEAGMKRVVEFAEAKDPSGQLLHPHFNDEMATRMNTLIRSGVARDLDHAYKMAVRENDELYQAEVEAKRNAALEQEKAKQAEAVAKAKRAAGTVAPKAPAPVRTAKREQTLDEIIDAALKQHS